MSAPFTILLVEDDSVVRDVVVQILLAKDFHVLAASDGYEAIRLLVAQHVDVMLADIMMPGLDGIETCRRMRGHAPTADIPIVMFSALSSDDDIERARVAGANHLITKPFNLVGLGSVVKTFFPADVSSAR